MARRRLFLAVLATCWFIASPPASVLQVDRLPAPTRTTTSPTSARGSADRSPHWLRSTRRARPSRTQCPRVRGDRSTHLRRGLPPLGDSSRRDVPRVHPRFPPHLRRRHGALLTAPHWLRSTLRARPFPDPCPRFRGDRSTHLRRGFPPRDSLRRDVPRCHPRYPPRLRHRCGTPPTAASSPLQAPSPQQLYPGARRHLPRRWHRASPSESRCLPTARHRRRPLSPHLPSASSRCRLHVSPLLRLRLVRGTPPSAWGRLHTVPLRLLPRLPVTARREAPCRLLRLHRLRPPPRPRRHRPFVRLQRLHRRHRRGTGGRRGARARGAQPFDRRR
ncbi:LOW QUALITY PROTEIN: hypothetical protein PAHAL_3G239900 [Panicum hallii]|uniref:Uncharacterized protein n=1 Tax=Panicum hallii TaxID=206008 RepID=A0A2T8KJ62_9POAL|nr:LOW QUALITY PROTEIN: hypothetical protein PAHAL_3G239900 [Panicum hallii]